MKKGNMRAYLRKKLSEGGLLQIVRFQNEILHCSMIGRLQFAKHQKLCMLALN